MKHLGSVLFLAEMLCGGAAGEGCKIYILWQKICRFFNVLIKQFSFNTNETKLDYYHQNLNVWVISWVVEQLKSYLHHKTIISHLGHRLRMKYILSINLEYFEVTKLDLLIEINNCNNFQESFEQFRGLGLNSRPFSV